MEEDKQSRKASSSAAASMAALADAAAAGAGADGAVPPHVEEHKKLAAAAAASSSSSPPTAAVRRGAAAAAGAIASGRGSGGPRCQAERCGADLSEAGRYHRRHKVCETHSKAPVVLVAGLRQRFCQQCSRFHELSVFDADKRSCRQRLAGHNERRRKSSADAHGRGAGDGCRHADQDGRGDQPVNHFQIR